VVAGVAGSGCLGEGQRTRRAQTHPRRSGGRWRASSIRAVRPCRRPKMKAPLSAARARKDVSGDPVRTLS
jgi:hypothetical protein